MNPFKLGDIVIPLDDRLLTPTGRMYFYPGVVVSVNDLTVVIRHLSGPMRGRDSVWGHRAVKYHKEHYLKKFADEV